MKKRVKYRGKVNLSGAAEQSVVVLARNIGVSPSGKATDSDSVIREFKSLHPSQTKRTGFCLFFLFNLRSG